MKYLQNGLILQDNFEKTDFHERLAEAHPELSESVMENSSKDRVSHFFLRLAMAHINDYDVKQRFLEQETCLFTYRLRMTTRINLTKSLCDVIRHIDELKNDEDFRQVKPIIRICNSSNGSYERRTKSSRRRCNIIKLRRA